MKVQTFSNGEFKDVRVMVKDEEPWFVGKDVAEQLGYSNPRKAIRDHVDNEDRGEERIVPTHGGFPQQMLIINESGLYSLIFASKLEKARAFKRWVTSDVLPTIRKHGAYLTEDAMTKFSQDPDYGIKLLNTLKHERTERLKMLEQNMQLALENDRMKPMADYCAKILACMDTVTVTQIAQDYGMTAEDFNEMLADMGIQYRLGRQWILYSGYKQQGYVQSNTSTYTRFDGKTGIRVSTRWTQLGRLWLYEKLKANGIMPVE